MPTSTSSTAPSPTPAPPPTTPNLQAGPPVTAYMTVWVYRHGVAEVGGQVGYVQVLKATGASLIAAGNAVDPYAVGTLPYVTHTPAPTPAPSPSPSPSPAPPAAATRPATA